jgi:L-aminopeptidase/D-esterase-like protein
MTLEEKSLNGIDLESRSATLAALRSRRLCRLAEAAHQKGLTGSTPFSGRALIRFSTDQTWDAPGLGNRCGRHCV